MVFVTRLRQVAAGEFPIPESSMVGVQATREWGGHPERQRLTDLLTDVDDLVEN